MRFGRFRFTLRRMMVAVAVIGLLLAYPARYYACNSIAKKHFKCLVSIGNNNPFARSPTEREMETYYETNYIKYKRAAIYPWVRVQHRFVPFDEARRSETAR
jgi:hypothetical protein